MAKKSFVMYQDWKAAIDLMTDEQAGKLLKAIYAYQEDPGADVDDPAVKMVFQLMKGRFKADAESYEATCKRRAENGRLGGLAKAGKSCQMLANASKSWQGLANLADNDNDNVNDNDNGNDNVRYIGRKNKFHNFNERDNHGIQEALLKKQWS